LQADGQGSGRLFVSLDAFSVETAAHLVLKDEDTLRCGAETCLRLRDYAGRAVTRRHCGLTTWPPGWSHIDQ
jgi:hypothetical protein